MSAGLLTERLRLRELTAADAAHVHRMNSDARVLRYLDEPPLESPAHALEILRTLVFPQYARGIGRWACELREDGTFLGWCGLKYLPDADAYDLGYRILVEHWGRGYATEAARAVLAHGRARLPDARITARARCDNTGSIRVLQKIGMRLASISQEPDGDTAIYVAD